VDYNPVTSKACPYYKFLKNATPLLEVGGGGEKGLRLGRAILQQKKRKE